eukprot:9115542-Pyramimonas_sp.AAC.1
MMPCEPSHWSLRQTGAPYGATNRLRGVPNWARWCHANPPTGSFGGAPYGATKREGCAELGA